MPMPMAGPGIHNNGPQSGRASQVGARHARLQSTSHPAAGAPLDTELRGGEGSQAPTGASIGGSLVTDDQ